MLAPRGTEAELAALPAVVLVAAVLTNLGALAHTAREALLLVRLAQAHPASDATTVAVVLWLLARPADALARARLAEVAVVRFPVRTAVAIHCRHHDQCMTNAAGTPLRSSTHFLGGEFCRGSCAG